MSNINTTQSGKLNHNMTNDYMFRAVLQKNEKVLRELIGALPHLNLESIEVEITNPIILVSSFKMRKLGHTAAPLSIHKFLTLSC